MTFTCFRNPIILFRAAKLNILSSILYCLNVLNVLYINQDDLCHLRSNCFQCFVYFINLYDVPYVKYSEVRRKVCRYWKSSAEGEDFWKAGHIFGNSKVISNIHVLFSNKYLVKKRVKVF